MACFKISSPSDCKDSCDQLDGCDIWDCLDPCSADCCMRPMGYRCCKPSTSTNKTADKKSSSQTDKSANTGSEKSKKCPTPAPVAKKKPEKFCIRVNVAGFDEKDVKVKAENGKVTVEANQGDRQQYCGCSVQKVKNCYSLPKQADAARMTSKMVSDGILLIEVPYGDSQKANSSEKAEKCKDKGSTQSPPDSLEDYIKRLANADFCPRIIDLDNAKALEMTIDVKKCPLEEIDASIKDNELVVQGEHIRKENGRSKRARFYRLTTLPDGAKTDQMTKKLDEEGQLVVQIPL
ncbi:unnamed protein product [Adineta ricciae]|uniref:SHSP domain-containing protein n=1 Tax=Adineta ricciae TaxID=249248 RepID=A0A815CL28_ADIRI|nr:unnamed protein product [Adineta ricciae]CAF1285115.1 unnamed protein product [Adineta ricciae]